MKSADQDDRVFLNRLADLAERGSGFSDFLDMHQSSLVRGAMRSWLKGGVLHGGYDDAERVMLGFGAVSEAFPIEVIAVSVAKQDELAHRDILGSLIGLGIKREVLGDICKSDFGFYVFAHSRIAAFVCDNFEMAGRKKIQAEISEYNPERVTCKTEEIRKTVSSLRLDCVLAAACNVSRGKAEELVASGRCFVDGVCATKSEMKLADGQKVTVRGQGRFIVETAGVSKKGKQIIVLTMVR